MRLSVACTFEPGLLARLAEFPEVKEVYGKPATDAVGGGRLGYTLRPVSMRCLRATIGEAHARGLAFNYLLNGATLGGQEQNRAGQRRIRALVDRVAEAGADAVTVASPHLMRIVKMEHPALRVRVSAFAVIDSPGKARWWEDMGADTLCVSAISCNRDLDRLTRIREAVRCDLQLIANASCLLNCSHELTHMNLLSDSSRTGDRNGGFCLDYCFLDCSARRLSDPVNLIRATWIRPEDLHYYEAIGYDHFKILERSCPGDLLVKRVAAYVNRRFDGNLMELVGPVAQIKREQRASLRQRARVVVAMFRPWKVKTRALLDTKKFMELVVQHDYSRDTGPLYVDNRGLDGFLEGLRNRTCEAMRCEECGYCKGFAEKAVRYDSDYRCAALGLARGLENGLAEGSVWF